MESHGETWSLQTQFQNNHLAKPNHFFYLICGTVTWSHMERRGTCKPNFKTTIWQNQTIFFDLWHSDVESHGETWNLQTQFQNNHLAKPNHFFYLICGTVTWSHMERLGTCKPNFKTTIWQNQTIFLSYLICGTVTWSHLERLGTCKPNFKTTIWPNQTIFFI